MNKITIFLIALLSITLCFTACKKEEVQEATTQPTETSLFSNNENVRLDDISFKVQNDLVNFESEEDFTKMVNYMNDKSADEMNELFSSLGLKNANLKVQSLLEQIHTMEDENEIIDFVNANSKYLQFIEHDADNKEIVPVGDLFANYFANENFEFQINDEVLDIRKDIVALDINDRAHCGNSYEAIETKNVAWCKNDRRAKLRIKVFKRNSSIVCEWRLKGQKKFSCIWANYRTDLETFSTLKANITIGNSTDVWEEDGKIENFSSELCHTATASLANDFSINWASGSGTTAGISGNVFVNCN